jgi:ABC-type polysaccharide/polyol phosphate export permease
MKVGKRFINWSLMSMVMEFDGMRITKSAGMIVGYFCSYVIFTAILYIMMLILGKIPESWSIAHVMAITAPIALFGFTIGGVLR